MVRTETISTRATAPFCEEGRLADLRDELEGLAYSISHDLRAPVRAITGFADLLREDYADKLDEEGRRFVSVIQRNAEQLNRSIEDVLRLSRLGRQEVRAIDMDLAAKFQGAFEAARERYQASSAECRISELPRVSGDPHLLGEVADCLMDNAIKFRRPDQALLVEVYASLTDDACRVTVSDNGIGFAPAEAAKAFRAFGRLNDPERYPGNGMGLAIVRRVIARHGGRVTASSSPGTGTMIRLTLPLKQQEAAHE